MKKQLDSKKLGFGTNKDLNKQINFQNLTFNLLTLATYTFLL